MQVGAQPSNLKNLKPDTSKTPNQTPTQNTTQPEPLTLERTCRSKEVGDAGVPQTLDGLRCRRLCHCAQNADQGACTGGAANDRLVGFRGSR